MKNRNLDKLVEKYLYWSSFFGKAAGWAPATIPKMHFFQVFWIDFVQIYIYLTRFLELLFPRTSVSQASNRSYQFPINLSPLKLYIQSRRLSAKKTKDA